MFVIYNIKIKLSLQLLLIFISLSVLVLLKLLVAVGYFFNKITFHLITNSSESKCKRHLLCTNFLCSQYAGEEMEAVKITLGLTLAWGKNIYTFVLRVWSLRIHDQPNSAFIVIDYSLCPCHINAHILIRTPGIMD